MKLCLLFCFLITSTFACEERFLTEKSISEYANSQELPLSRPDELISILKKYRVSLNQEAENMSDLNLYKAAEATINKLMKERGYLYGAQKIGDWPTTIDELIENFIALRLEEVHEQHMANFLAQPMSAIGFSNEYFSENLPENTDREEIKELLDLHFITLKSIVHIEHLKRRLLNNEWSHFKTGSQRERYQKGVGNNKLLHSGGWKTFNLETLTLLR